jgi:hypothetical protein
VKYYLTRNDSKAQSLVDHVVRSIVDGLDVVNYYIYTRSLPGPYIIAAAMPLRNRLDGVTITSLMGLPPFRPESPYVSSAAGVPIVLHNSVPHNRSQDRTTAVLRSRVSLWRT